MSWIFAKSVEVGGDNFGLGTSPGSVVGGMRGQQPGLRITGGRFGVEG